MKIVIVFPRLASLNGFKNSKKPSNAGASKNYQPSFENFLSFSCYILFDASHLRCWFKAFSSLFVKPSFLVKCSFFRFLEWKRIDSYLSTWVIAALLQIEIWIIQAQQKNKCKFVIQEIFSARFLSFKFLFDYWNWSRTPLVTTNQSEWR